MSDVTVHPLTPERWDDFVAVCRQMGPNRGCWCMFWRDEPGGMPARPRKEAARQVVDGAPPPGLLAYADGEPVGWVAVAPRAAYPRLNAGRDTAPVGDEPGTWAIPCFFVADGHRGEGIAAVLLDAAIAFAATRGARFVDGVPGDPAIKTRSPAASFTGSLPLFQRAGFEEVARRTRTARVVVQRRV
jgi:GNAT superfamily N-acetyltransferase